MITNKDDFINWLVSVTTSIGNIYNFALEPITKHSINPTLIDHTSNQNNVKLVWVHTVRSPAPNIDPIVMAFDILNGSYNLGEVNLYCKETNSFYTIDELKIKIVKILDENNL